MVSGRGGIVLFVEVDAAAKSLCAKNRMVGDDEKKTIII